MLTPVENFAFHMAFPLLFNVKKDFLRRWFWRVCNNCYITDEDGEQFTDFGLIWKEIQLISQYCQQVPFQVLKYSIDNHFPIKKCSFCNEFACSGYLEKKITPVPGWCYLRIFRNCHMALTASYVLGKTPLINILLQFLELIPGRMVYEDGLIFAMSKDKVLHVEYGQPGNHGEVLRTLRLNSSKRIGAPLVPLSDLDYDVPMTTLPGDVLSSSKIEEIDDYVKGLESENNTSVEELKVGFRKREKLAKKSRIRRDSDLLPSDSVSVQIRDGLRDIDDKHKELKNEIINELRSQLGTELASKASSTLSARSYAYHGDDVAGYEKDVSAAFKGSGVVKESGEFFECRYPRINSSDLVPDVTLDKRLNFLIRLHTALFNLLPMENYPGKDFMLILKRLRDGKYDGDHPSFDLLTVVLEESIDWRRMMVRDNKFCLPVLEPGLKLNERVVVGCLRGLLFDYKSRWTNLFKDCIIPPIIQDLGIWRDSVYKDDKGTIANGDKQIARRHKRAR